MSRIRTIKPSFFQSDDVSALPLRARLTWIGLWTHCDDAGRTKDHARLIKAAIWPLDNVSLADIEQDLTILADHGRIVRYVVGDQHYLEITNWSEHQTINRPTPSKIPPPTAVAVNGTKPSSTATAVAHPRLTELPVSTHDGKGRERKGREGNARAGASVSPAESEPEPPTRCDKHLNSRNPPNCGGCAEARKQHTRWEAERSRRDAAAPKCRIHRGQPAHNCANCRAEELAPA